jgi:hypothetical protein
MLLNSELFLFLFLPATRVVYGLGQPGKVRLVTEALVRIIAEVHAINPAKLPLILWDYSGRNDIATKPVPAIESDGHMGWYRDSSHYSSQTGNMIIDLVTGSHATVDSPPDNFGAVLDEKAMDGYLRRLQLAKENDQKNNSAEIEYLEKLRQILKSGLAKLSSELVGGCGYPDKLLDYPRSCQELFGLSMRQSVH